MQVLRFVHQVLLVMVTLTVSVMTVRGEAITPTPAPAPDGVNGSVARVLVPVASDNSGIMILQFAVTEADVEGDPDVGTVSELLGEEFGQQVTELDPDSSGMDVSFDTLP